MIITSIEFNQHSHPDKVECFELYKLLLKANNNNYKLRYITSTNNKIIFGRIDKISTNQQINKFTVNNISINFII